MLRAPAARLSFSLLPHAQDRASGVHDDAEGAGARHLGRVLDDVSTKRLGFGGRRREIVD